MGLQRLEARTRGDAFDGQHYRAFGDLGELNNAPVEIQVVLEGDVNLSGGQ
jgi:hypothetical protein